MSERIPVTRTQAKLKAKVEGTHLEREKFYQARKSLSTSNMQQLIVGANNENGDGDGRMEHGIRLNDSQSEGVESKQPSSPKKKKAKVCDTCKCAFRPPPCNPRKLAKGMRVEVCCSALSNANINNNDEHIMAEGPVYIPGTVLSVRSTRNIDVMFDPPSLFTGSTTGRFDVGSQPIQGKKETNIDPNFVRLLQPWRCMCKTRKSLGYEVAPLSSTSLLRKSQSLAKDQTTNDAEAKGKHEEEDADEDAAAGDDDNDERRSHRINSHDNVDASVNNPLRYSSSAQAYRGTGTVLAKTWNDMQKLDQRERKVRQTEYAHEVANRLSNTNNEDFAAKQRAWDVDRKLKAEAKRKQLEAEMMAPDYKHLMTRSQASKSQVPSTNNYTQPPLPPSQHELEAQRGGGGGQATTKQQNAMPHRPQSRFEPQLSYNISTSHSTKPLAFSGMEDRWEPQCKLKMQKELISLGFKRQEVISAIDIIWAKYDKKLKSKKYKHFLQQHIKSSSSTALKSSGDGGGASSDDMEMSISKLPNVERSAMVERVRETALKWLEEHQPGNHVVGEVVRVLDKEPTVLDSTYKPFHIKSSTGLPSNKDGDSEEGDKHDDNDQLKQHDVLGVVQSFDAMRMKYLVKVYEVVAPTRTGHDDGDDGNDDGGGGNIGDKAEIISKSYLMNVDATKVEILDKVAADLFLSSEKVKKASSSSTNSQGVASSSYPSQPNHGHQQPQHKVKRYDVGMLDEFASHLLPEQEGNTNDRMSTQPPSSLAGAGGRGGDSSSDDVDGRNNMREGDVMDAVQFQHKPKFLTSAAQGRLKALQKQQEVEALQKRVEEKRKRKERKLREVLGKHGRETSEINRQIALAKVAVMKGEMRYVL
jgi:hypothetical protein